MDPLETAVRVGLFFVPFLFALCFHEFAHGFVAKMRGDNTAEMMGRLTLNPLPHIDWIGTVGLPIMALMFSSPLFFGWAKPVPVNPRNLRDPKNDMFWVALAGPMSNVLLFFVGLITFYFAANFAGIRSTSPIGQMLIVFLYINIFLAIFNLLPLHPLDGGKIISRFLSPSSNRWLENNQYQLNIALIILIISGLLEPLFAPFIYMVNFAVGSIEAGVI